MTDRSTSPLPALGPGDVYVYAHANGAIFVGYADGRSLLAPLGEVVAVAEGCHAAGSRVVAGADPAPIATAVLDRIRASGVPVADFVPSEPPHSWNEGTDALIEAASVGTHAILDDLIERGADVHHRDASGSTALHHAAANGNLHAIDALVVAGAEVDRANSGGLTPHGLAVACREPEAVARLVALGASTATSAPLPGAVAAPTADSSGPVEFRRVHFAVAYVWFVPLLLPITVLLVAWPPSLLVGALLAAFVAVVLVVVPPPAFWAGGIPRRLDGTDLTIRSPFGRRRVVDLTRVTLAAAGGATSATAFHSARWLLLVHPDGHPVGRRALRRLLLPGDELAALGPRLDRVIVVPLDGPRSPEVVLPVGTALEAHGIELSPTLRAQLAAARRRPARR